jgi:hypothetical protein
MLPIKLAEIELFQVKFFGVSELAQMPVGGGGGGCAVSQTRADQGFQMPV